MFEWRFSSDTLISALAVLIALRAEFRRQNSVLSEIRVKVNLLWADYVKRRG